jgi:hypothetical protein
MISAKGRDQGAVHVGTPFGVFAPKVVRDCVRVWVHFFMRVDVLSVREAREQLPRLLERFRGGDRSPIFLGSHRKTEAVMIPVQVYEELTQRRLNAVADATASVRAEGLEPSARSEIIIDQWVHGQISAEEMERQIAALHGLSL